MGLTVMSPLVPPGFCGVCSFSHHCYRAEFFQYLIGNTDFSFVLGADECCHNSRVFITESGRGGFIPVPYDFDQSGIVNAPYATPNPALKIASVKTRVYRGIQTSQQVFDDTIEFDLNRQEAILALWQNSPLLEKRDRTECIAYLGKTFKTLQDPTAIRTNIIPTVRPADALSRHLAGKNPESFSECQDEESKESAESSR